MTAGDCFTANGRYFMDNFMFGDSETDAYLVHGEVAGQGPLEGITFAHCWIEVGDTVLDFSNGRSLNISRDLYYLIGKIDEIGNVFKYDKERARKKLYEEEFFGPWDLQARLA